MVRYRRQRRHRRLAQSTFWFVLATLPMFLLLPWLLRNDVSFWAALALSCLVTVTLYAVMVRSLGKIRIDF
jgi:hypothetical protein